MPLFERLVGTETPKIPVHSFMAALGEYERGKMTGQQVIDAFGLSVEEQGQASTLLAKVSAPVDTISFGGYNLLTNVGNTYDATGPSKGLGLVRLETSGISAFEFLVNVSKIGSGTQSWQLWDVTNGAEIARIDDAGAAGDKLLSTGVVTLGAPLGVGYRVLRVRVKSTTAADDPVFYGATLNFRRVGFLNADVLHQILLLAEQRISPLDTPAALAARLGM